jgi:hypothetical protein
MATATKRPSGPPPPPKPSKTKPAAPSPEPNRVLRGVDALYRFLASLKLAVICLLSLAFVLGYGTFYESWYGTKAVQEAVYQSKWFAMLLAFLGTNILCAALIRFPWKKRQTGFVITHAGLLIVLAGSLYSFYSGDEGQVALLEGESAKTMVRTDAPVIRLHALDPETKEPVFPEYVLPFRPGAFAWSRGRSEVLSDSRDPFKLVVKKFLPASAPKYLHEAAEGGAPMIRFGLSIQPPNMLRPMDPFEKDFTDDLRWFSAGNRFRRQVKDLGGVRLVFQHITKEGEGWKVDDFLHPPKDATTEVARIHYRDNSGKDRVYEWVVEEKGEGETRALPESDLSATFVKQILIPDESGILKNQTGESEFPAVLFKVRKGDGEEVDHYGWWSPAAPTILPNQKYSGEPLVRIGYYHPPHLGNMVRGVVEVLGTEDGKLYYRAINRSGVQSSGTAEIGKPVKAFGGGPNQPMTLTFRVDEFLKSGREKFTYVPIELPKGQMGNGIPAAEIELIIDGEPQEFWVRPSGDFRPDLKTVNFKRKAYRVSYDFDRRPLDFSLRLEDFKVGFDPGTQQPSTFESKVLLTDEGRQIQNEPHTIWMNHPLVHEGLTFYQSSYNREQDPHTGQETGRFMSVFQVRKDPAWPIVYLGCLLVVLGIFAQFYMRAGIFTDGGKRERALEAAKEARREARTAPGDGNGTAGATPAGEPVADFEEL